MNPDPGETYHSAAQGCERLCRSALRPRQPRCAGAPALLSRCKRAEELANPMPNDQQRLGGVGKASHCDSLGHQQKHGCPNTVRKNRRHQATAVIPAQPSESVGARDRLTTAEGADRAGRLGRRSAPTPAAGPHSSSPNLLVFHVQVPEATAFPLERIASQGAWLNMREERCLPMVPCAW